MSFKRHLIIGLTFIFIFATVAGCSGSGNSSNSGLKNDTPEGVAEIYIKALANQDVELFNIINKTGFNADIWMEYGREIGVIGQDWKEYEIEIKQDTRNDKLYYAGILINEDLLERTRAVPNARFRGFDVIQIVKFEDGKYYFTKIEP